MVLCSPFRCNGKRVCELNTNVFHTSDPCVGTFKYLDITFTCLPAIYLVACEGSVAHLHCDKGQVINVHGADYGRRDQTTCSYQRPTAQIQDVYCSRVTSSVGESCNGKNNCTINVSNSVFGDPCVGTYKYLELAYTCECKYLKGLFGLFHSAEDPLFQQPLVCSVTTGTMLCFRLSSTLLLAATCLLMSAVLSTERVITCDNRRDVLHLSCDATDSAVISVQSALYGRADSSTCSAGRPPQQVANTECSQEGTLDTLKNRCNGKRVCELNTNVFHTSDPCVGTFKYLDITFTCLPAIYLVACEGSVAHLHCDQGQVINVHGADYGRHDRTTCSYQRPTAQIQNVYCSRVPSSVGESCNGKNTCTINVSNSVFRDPCVGTYKYLELAYTCEYPV
uniref:L-rhamnose-binding lectin CSL1-like n=1 Tax=Centroberyx gerrardi TaxID=166262 RepID=UPI003AAC1FC3